MSKKYNIAIVGATGNVGREVLEILEEREFPIEKLFLLASEDSFGKKIDFCGKVYTVDVLDNVDFSEIDIAIFSAGSKVSAKYAPIVAEKGCYVIDNTSYFRMQKDIPLVVSQVNPEDLELARSAKIISNPNCTTMQILVPLKLLHDEYSVKRCVVSTYQAVSGAGNAAMDELYMQTKKVYEASSLPPSVFSKEIAFNCIPVIGNIADNLNTDEEEKIVNETKKILKDGRIGVSATCVRVPVFNCHSVSINIEFHNEYDLEEIKHIFNASEDIDLLDNVQKGHFITPKEATKSDQVFISRLRRDNSIENGLNMWIVSDNLRKGAALNAVEIAEILIERKFV